MPHRRQLQDIEDIEGPAVMTAPQRSSFFTTKNKQTQPLVSRCNSFKQCRSIAILLLECRVGGSPHVAGSATTQECEPKCAVAFSRPLKQECSSLENIKVVL